MARGNPLTPRPRAYLGLVRLAHFYEARDTCDSLWRGIDCAKRECDQIELQRIEQSPPPLSLSSGYV
jgi:hypothetical protein